jgi:hypothetical protein
MLDPKEQKKNGFRASADREHERKLAREAADGAKQQARPAKDGPAGAKEMMSPPAKASELHPKSASPSPATRETGGKAKSKGGKR